MPRAGHTSLTMARHVLSLHLPHPTHLSTHLPVCRCPDPVLPPPPRPLAANLLIVSLISYPIHTSATTKYPTRISHNDEVVERRFKNKLLRSVRHRGVIAVWEEQVTYPGWPQGAVAVSGSSYQSTASESLSQTYSADFSCPQNSGTCYWWVDPGWNGVGIISPLPPSPPPPGKCSRLIGSQSYSLTWRALTLLLP